MPVIPSILRLLTAAVSLALVSCIDGHEEYWLNADGSGRAEVTYVIPASAAALKGGEAGVRNMIEAALANSGAVSKPVCLVTTSNGRITVHVAGEFASVSEIRSAAKSAEASSMPAAAKYMAGEFKVARDGRTLDFNRTITPGRALAGSMFMPASEFRGHELSYIVHLPVPAESNNATLVRDGGRTLEWKIPLSQAIRNPFSTRFTAKIPIPRWIWASTGAVAAVILTGGVFWMKKRRRTVVVRD